MKSVTVTGAAAAGLLVFGMMIPAFAQHDGQSDKQGDQQKKADRSDRPQGKQNKGAPSQQNRAPQAKQQPPQQGQRTQQQRPQGQPAQQPQQAQQPGQQRQQRPPQQTQQPQQRVQQKQPQQRQQSQPSQQARGPSHPERTREQAQSWQQQRGWLKQGDGWQGHDTWQQNRAQHLSSDHRTWAQRGGYGGYYVPQASFNLYFGNQHFFRIGRLPVIYMGYPRFEYRGYSFLLLDPWPEYWSSDWYASDDVYIDYDDGYYLYNRRYPQVRLAITLAL